VPAVSKSPTRCSYRLNGSIDISSRCIYEDVVDDVEAWRDASWLISDWPGTPVASTLTAPSGRSVRLNLKPQGVWIGVPKIDLLLALRCDIPASQQRVRYECGAQHERPNRSIDNVLRPHLSRFGCSWAAHRVQPLVRRPTPPERVENSHWRRVASSTANPFGIPTSRHGARNRLVMVDAPAPLEFLASDAERGTRAAAPRRQSARYNPPP
jgi:hypothetical protein